MTLTLNSVLQMVGRTISNPREGAAEVLALGIPREALWTILVLVVVLSVLMAQVTALLLPQSGNAFLDGMAINPVTGGLLQLGLLLTMVYAVYFVGRAMGGTGSVEESMLLVSWLQFIMVVLQVLQTLLFLISPLLGGLVGVLALALFLWLLTNFVAVLHGFRSLAQVFVMILLAAFGLAMVLSIVLSILGIAPDVTAPQV